MKPEVVVLLVVNLLPFGNPLLPAGVAAAASLTNERGALANNVLRPAGTEFEARRKRSLPGEYQAAAKDGSHRRRPRGLTMSGGDGQRMAQPDGDSDPGRWNNHASKLSSPPHRAARRDWGQSDMEWIRRRSPEAFAPPGGRDGGWSEVGLEWIKRRQKAEAKPATRRWENTGFSWLKRAPATPNLHASDDEARWTEDTRDAMDKWDGGFVDIDWIKRRPRLLAV